MDYPDFQMKEFISYKHYDEKGNKQMFIAF